MNRMLANPVKYRYNIKAKIVLIIISLTRKVYKTAHDYTHTCELIIDHMYTRKKRLFITFVISMIAQATCVPQD